MDFPAPILYPINHFPTFGIFWRRTQRRATAVKERMAVVRIWTGVVQAPRAPAGPMPREDLSQADMRPRISMWLRYIP